MKKNFFLGIAFCLLSVILAGCDPPAPNELMGNASAENSAFMFYAFDGETVLSRIVFQSASHRQDIIDELQSVPAARVTDWTLDDITLPVYA